jgi:hypothetical protein
MFGSRSFSNSEPERSISFGKGGDPVPALVETAGKTRSGTPAKIQ